MVLDEPTNHLDIDSREILEELLLAFDGTILFVSHDRYFIQKIANRIGEIDQLKLQYYEGDYDYYKFMKRKQQQQQSPSKKKKTVVKPQKKKSRDVLKEAEEIENKMHMLELEMEKHSFDAKALEELYQEKQELEKTYVMLLDLLEE